MQSNNNNLVTEISAIVLASLLTIISAALLYLGKIDYNGALGLWGVAASIFGFNLAFKAPSPSQQAQLNAQHQSLQQILAPVVSALPGLLQLLQLQSLPAQVLQTETPVTPQPAVFSGEITQSPVAPPQFKAPVAQPAVEHPPIEPGMMVNTLPTLPAFGQQPQQ